MNRKLLFFSALALLVSCSTGEPEHTNSAHKTIVVGATTDTLSSVYSAAVEGRQDVSILPQVSGCITRVCVTEGQRVSTGQTLFEIDRVNFEAALRVAEANVKAAEALVATNQLTYDSKKTLFAQNVISEFDLKVAENALLTAKASLAQAQAGVVNARQNLSYTLVKSPCNGVVGKLPYRKGTLVSPQMPAPLTTVSDNSEMYVYFSMTEGQMLSMVRRYGSTEKAIRELPDLKLQLCNGDEYPQPGRIESISGVIDKQTGAVSVRAVFPNPDKLLLSGGSCNVVIPTVCEDVIIIPQEATYEVQDKVFAFRVVDGKAVSTMIEVEALPDGKRYIVTSGLAEGDSIVAEGAGLIKEGEQVL